MFCFFSKYGQLKVNQKQVSTRKNLIVASVTFLSQSVQILFMRFLVSAVTSLITCKVIIDCLEHNMLIFI